MKRPHLLLILASVLLLIVSAGLGTLWFYGSRTTVPVGSTAGGLPIGGLEKQKALQLLQAYSSALDERTVTLDDSSETAASAEDKPAAALQEDFSVDSAEAVDATDESALPATAPRTAAWTLRQLGLRMSLDEAAKAIQRLGEGSLWSRAQYRWQWSKHLPATLKSNRAVFEAALRQKWGFYDKQKPVNAVRTISAGDRVVYTPGRSVLHLDYERQYSQVQAWAELTSPEARSPKRGSAHLPSSQTLVNLKGTELLHTLGIEPALQSRLQLKSIQPKVTLDSLKAEGVERLIVSFTTDYSTSSQGRAFNVSETARTLNGWLLKPGDVFDYGEIIRITERETGYREASVILNGRFTSGIGGGICQVSSTLYNAVLRAGLEIVERRNHSIPVPYLPKGQDATFAEGGINFRFRNSSGKYLLIQTSAGNGRLTVKLFGTMPRNVRYDIRSETVRTLTPEVQLKPTSLLAPGERRTLNQGNRGYVVDTYRIRYENGVEKSRSRISRDTYKAQPRIIGIGRAGEADETSTAPEGLLEDGIRVLPDVAGSGGL